MAYARSASAQKFIDQAHTKLVCYYQDGNARTWYGRPGLPGGRQAADPYSVELKRHQRYVEKTAASIKTALLYDKVSGREIARFEKGQWCWARG
ncbi:hypothetical protein GCM10027048_20170 [Hymenobacter coalescens]